MYVAKRTEGAPGAPLFLTFHGTGGNEAQFHGLAEQLVPGARVVSPRGDVSEHGALRFFRRKGEGVYDMEDLAARTAAMIDFVTAEKGDAPRVIGLGYSNGANILAAVAMNAGHLFDDLILMHPLIPWAPAPEPSLAGRRVLITAGERDPICPRGVTKEVASWFEAQGADVTLHWHPGGHEIAESELQAAVQFLG
ncbi:alpha/beta hydrolase [Oceaniglobus roseus]|uniref:alpha/beta hydrolase n=1 Tax=Oceaniglobus roseus TaxID=1737570 RepID=UPI000C7F639E|nr:alpha/beta hydrolase [Kandeliimicrobium roseum]